MKMFLSMNKTALLTVLAAAAMTAALSCSKEEKAPVAGKPITVTVGAPVVDVDPATSVELTGVSPYTVAWEAGDKIQIINYTFGEAAINEWDCFTTATGGATASFSGTAGASTQAKYTAFSVYSDATCTTHFVTGASTKMIYANIPATQDGTGIKYSLFATRDVTYDGASLTINGMALRSALTRFDIAGTAFVKRVTVTVNYENSGTYSAAKGYGLCVGPDPEASKAMPIYNFKADNLNFSNAVGGKGGTITIENGGAQLTGPVYMASRHTVDAGGKTTLTFVFTDDSDHTATRTVTLVTSDESKKYTITNAKLTYLGTVTLNTEDFS